MTAQLHLDPTRWVALLEDRAAPEERAALLVHLEEPCETCETFLVEIGGRGALDRLDGATDEALIAMGRAQPDLRFDEIGFLKVTRAIAQRRSRRRLVRALPVAGALAASIALAVLLRPITPEDPSHLKGPEPSAEPKLRLVVADRDRVLHDHDRVSIGATLVFRVELDTPGCVTLAVAKGSTTEQLLDPPLCSESVGAHAIAKEGQVLGYRVDRSDAPSLSFTLSAVGRPAGEGDRITLEVAE